MPASFLTIRCCRRSCAAMRGIVGIARSQRKSQVSGRGRVLYETPAGARRTFRIQDLNSPFPVRCTSPWKSRTVRPGLTLTPHRFPSDAPPAWCAEMALGRPQDWDHHLLHRHIRLGGSCGGHQRLVAIWRRNWKTLIRPWRWEAVRILA